MPDMRIAVDTKNLALYAGGIAHWFAPLLAAWIEHRPDAHFLLVGPDFPTDRLPRTGNWEHVPAPWPESLHRPLRHPWYDNVVFPRAIRRLRPDLVLSPYHDVRMPSRVPSVITVHDLCIDELASVYPRRIRAYYLYLLRRNLRRARTVLTVSETSRDKLIERYGLHEDQVRVVFNATPDTFSQAPGAAEIDAFRLKVGAPSRLLLYPGGSEYRKNIDRLAQAFAKLAQTDPGLGLFVTGQCDPRWASVLEHLPKGVRERVAFLGKLDERDLCLAYAAADAVVYPSLCEGFGRVCLEAMECGTPLACSDLEIMREVAGDYAHYFYPFDVASIARSIEGALAQERRPPLRVERFHATAVRASFLAHLDQLMAGLSH